MALNKAFGYKSLRDTSVTAALFNSDVVHNGGAIVLDTNTRGMKLNLAADKGIEIAQNALGIKLESADALQVGANGLDLKATIAGARTFSGAIDMDSTLLVDGVATFNDNVVIEGDLVVRGMTTTVESQTLSVADRLVHLNVAADPTAANVPAPVGLSGIAVDRGTNGAAEAREAAGFVWDEANSKFIAAFLAADIVGNGGLLDVEMKNLAAVDAVLSGDLEAVGGDFSGNVTVDGTLGVIGKVTADDMDLGGDLVLGATAKITNAAANAAAQIDFAKDQAEAGWGAENPLNVAAALNALANMLAAQSTDLQDEVDDMEAAIGLNADGSYNPFSNSNYLDAATTIKGAIGLLDAEVKDVQDEINNVETAVGLDGNGNFVAFSNTHYIDAATSIKNASELLDAEVFAVQGELDLVEAAIGLDGNGNFVAFSGSHYMDAASSIVGSLNALDLAAHNIQTELNDVEAAIGLDANGDFVAFTTSNYMNAASSIVGALSALDSAIKTNDNAFDAYVAELASNTGAAQIGISSALITALGLDAEEGENTVQHGLDALNAKIIAETTARNAMKMQKVRHTISAEDISAGVDKVLTVPSYVQGSHALLVFVDGIAEDEPISGGAHGACFYTESSSTTITLNKDDLVEGMKIMVWVTPFQG